MKKNIPNICLKIAHDLFDEHPSHKHERNKFFHYSFIVINNDVIGYGLNQPTPANFPKLASYPYGTWVHSEVDAFFKHKRKLRDEKFSVINIRLNSFGELRNSKPCECCNNFLRAVGANEVYYSTEQGFVKFI